MERITYYSNGKARVIIGDTEYAGRISNKLASYEDAEEQGLLVRLPCQVGDTIWDRDVEPWTVISIERFSKKVTHLHCKSPITRCWKRFSIGKRSIGRSIFLTREEAIKRRDEKCMI